MKTISGFNVVRQLSKSTEFVFSDGYIVNPTQIQTGSGKIINAFTYFHTYFYVSLLFQRDWAEAVHNTSPKFEFHGRKQKRNCTQARDIFHPALLQSPPQPFQIALTLHFTLERCALKNKFKHAGRIFGLALGV